MRASEVEERENENPYEFPTTAVANYHKFSDVKYSDTTVPEVGSFT